jgi:chemotaxis methyl-accepting protein methylase
LKVDTVEEARAAISRDAALLDVVVGTLLNGTTEFFRDRPVFDFLAGTVLPALALRDGPIRVWSAACSSGAELYSIAIQLDRLGLLARGVLLGTDCRRGAIAEATAATYGDAALANVTGPLRRQYFEPVDGQWRAVVRLRHAVQWRVEDLATCPAEGTWDLILWRNAGMYLLPGPAAVTGAQLLASLRPGGYLVLGKAERPPAGLGAKQVAHCVYQRGGQ